MQPPRPTAPILFRPDLWILLGLSLVLHAGLLAFGPGWYLALSATLHNWGTAAAVAAPPSPAAPAAPVQPLPTPPTAVADLVFRSEDRSALGRIEGENRKAPTHVERSPVVKKSVSPAYPEIARRAQIEGRVVARVLVERCLAEAWGRVRRS